MFVSVCVCACMCDIYIYIYIYEAYSIYIQIFPSGKIFLLYFSM